MSASGSSSTLPSAGTLFDRARNAGSVEQILLSGVGGFILAFVTGFIETILSIFDVVIRPVSALAGALAGLVDAIFGESLIGVLSAGASATQESIGPGGAFDLGPLGLPVAVGVVLLTLWLIGRFRDEEETGNLVPGLPFDVPFIGESEEAGDE